MSNSALQSVHTLIVPITDWTDIFNGDPTTPAVNLANWREVALVLQLLTTGGSNTGKGRIEAYCADNSSKDNPVEIGYHYRKSNSGDSFGEIVEAIAGASSRAITDTGATLNDQYIAIIRQNKCKADKPWAYFKLSEYVNDPVVGRAFLILGKPLFAGPTLPTALS